MAGNLVNCIRHCDLNASVVIAEQCLQQCILSWTRCSEKDLLSLRELHESWLGASVAILLIPVGGLFAGLTLGLLSLDGITLKILEHAGEPQEREYARKIIPIRKQGNLLLCTLLLANTLTNASISILLADLTSGVLGLIISTFLILVFGEIIPQSICTRHGLAIGANLIGLVTICIALLSPITWPISKVLDFLLARDIGNVYSREELKHLIDIHVMDPDAQAESGLTSADQRLIVGALDYKHKRVKDVMTSLNQCFMLEKSLRLTFQAMMAIYKSGFTRIPVFSGDRQNVIGILYAKDLILADPDDCIEIATVLSFRGRNLAHVSEEAPLDEVLRNFVTGNNHIMIAHRSDSSGQTEANIESSVITGLITLEDVMETLIQQEIVDESDEFEDVNTGLRRSVQRADVANLLAMFEHKLHHHQALAPGELQAVCAYLTSNVPEFGPLAEFEIPLKGLISHAEVIELEDQSDKERDGEASHSPGSRRASLSLSSRLSRLASTEQGDTSDQLTLYESGVPSDTFTLILQGKVIIRTGEEKFEFERGPWNTLASGALSREGYVPDFDAVGVAPLRTLRFQRSAFLAALEATSLQPISNYQRSRSPGPQTESALQARLDVASPSKSTSSGSQEPRMPSDFNVSKFLQRKSQSRALKSASPSEVEMKALDSETSPLLAST